MNVNIRRYIWSEILMMIDGGGIGIWKVNLLKLNDIFDSSVTIIFNICYDHHKMIVIKSI